MAKYLLTVMIETPLVSDDIPFIQEEITKELVEQKVIDCLDYQVTHVFDLQQLPED